MALPHSGIPAADPAPQDATVDDLTAATLTVTGASTLGAVTATSVAAPHSGLTGVTADQHHAQSHGHTGADGSGTVAHSATTGQTANDHHNQVHAVDGADHSASGLTAGHVLRATGATTFAFGAIADGDIPATIARDTEVATAVSDHAALADPHTGYQKESERAAANGYASLDASAKVPVAQIRSVNAGTSFPGTPATNDQFFRTDRGILYYYDGTRWLSVALYAHPLGPGDAVLPLSANGTPLRLATTGSTYDWYLVDLFTTLRATTTNDGSNYWSAALRKFTAASAITTIVTPTTAAQVANDWVSARTAINALLGTTHTMLDLNCNKTGAPGTLYAMALLTYRLVG